MEDRLDNFFADADSEDEAVAIEEDFVEEDVAGWIPDEDEDGDDQVRPCPYYRAMMNCLKAVRLMHVRNSDFYICVLFCAMFQRDAAECDEDGDGADEDADEDDQV